MQGVIVSKGGAIGNSPLRIKLRRLVRPTDNMKGQTGSRQFFGQTGFWVLTSTDDNTVICDQARPLAVTYPS